MYSEFEKEQKLILYLTMSIPLYTSKTMICHVPFLFPFIFYLFCGNFIRKREMTFDGTKDFIHLKSVALAYLVYYMFNFVF